MQKAQKAKRLRMRRAKPLATVWESLAMARESNDNKLLRKVTRRWVLRLTGRPLATYVLAGRKIKSNKVFTNSPLRPSLSGSPLLSSLLEFDTPLDVEPSRDFTAPRNVLPSLKMPHNKALLCPPAVDQRGEIALIKCYKNLCLKTKNSN